MTPYELLVAYHAIGVAVHRYVSMRCFNHRPPFITAAMWPLLLCDALDEIISEVKYGRDI